MEVVNAYTELNDPVAQGANFAAQAERDEGSESVGLSEIDESFVVALEAGLPPTAGWGLGIDRLVMLLTNSDNIKEVIPFPLVRRKLTD
mmetsp:Transcript_6219/g.15362  ORF Transcript_6219/g.15362 Transcript_6219/m.15362 type:complete len:89 (-) Transcript_6219:115-381(-)